jgi:hypothetical protein
MAKFERVTKLTDLVTYEGAIELSEEQVKETTH